MNNINIAIRLHVISNLYNPSHVIIYQQPVVCHDFKKYAISLFKLFFFLNNMLLNDILSYVFILLMWNSQNGANILHVLVSLNLEQLQVWSNLIYL